MKNNEVKWRSEMKSKFIGESGAFFCGGCGALNEPPKKILDIRRASTSMVGKCMLCTRDHRMVNVITTPTHYELRLCDKCVKEIRSMRHT